MKTRNDELAAKSRDLLYRLGPLRPPLQIIPVKLLIQKTGQKIRLLKDLPEIQHNKNKPLKVTPNLPDYYEPGQRKLCERLGDQILASLQLAVPRQ